MKKRPKLKRLPKYPDGDVFRNQSGQEQPINIGNSGVYSDANGNTYGMSNSQNNTGQYAAAGTAALAGGANIGNVYNDDESTYMDKYNATSQGATGVVSAISPVWGAATAATYKVAQPIKNSLEKTENGRKASYVAGHIFDPLSSFATDIGTNSFGFKDYEKAYQESQNNNSFAGGGIMPNAEVEKQENTISPNGDFTQYNGPSHEMGGIPTNLDAGERIFSDRLKMPGTKKTFAQLNKKNDTSKEDKILNDKKANKVTKSTAELIAKIKRRKSDELFNAQESLKMDKLKKYAEKMGVTIPEQNINPNSSVEYRNGGTKLPKYYNGDVHDPNKPYSFTQDYQSDRVGPLVTAMDTPIYNTFYTPDDTNKLVNDNRYLTNQQILNQDNKQSVKDVNNSRQEVLDGVVKPGSYRLQSPGTDGNIPNITQNRNFRQPNYAEAIEPAINTGLQNVGNIWDLYQTRFGKKYDKEDSGQLTPERLNPAEALRQANMENRARSKNLRNIANSGGYKANMIAGQNANTMNKARIIQDFENANVGIGNQFMMHNQSTRMQDKANEQMNKARSEDIARQAIRGIGTNTSAAYRDYKAGKMDVRTASLLSSMFRDYKLDMSNPNDWKIVFNKLQEGK